MKTLYIIRHAKSSWADYNQSDFERPLNDRGNQNAPVMAEKLLKKNIHIDAFLSSPALRARQTCEHFCNTFHADKNDIIFVDELYHAAATTIRNVIAKSDDRHHAIAVFTHNPGITDYVNTLCENVYIDNMPTCGIFAVSSGIDNWEHFSESEKTFLFFDSPKSV